MNEPGPHPNEHKSSGKTSLAARALAAARITRLESPQYTFVIGGVAKSMGKQSTGIAMAPFCLSRKGIVALTAGS